MRYEVPCTKIHRPRYASWLTILRQCQLEGKEQHASNTWDRVSTIFNGAAICWLSVCCMAATEVQTIPSWDKDQDFLLKTKTNTKIMTKGIFPALRPRPWSSVLDHWLAVHMVKWHHSNLWSHYDLHVLGLHDVPCEVTWQRCLVNTIRIKLNQLV